MKKAVVLFVLCLMLALPYGCNAQDNQPIDLKKEVAQERVARITFQMELLKQQYEDLRVLLDKTKLELKSMEVQGKKDEKPKK